jgi:hypothetical protein
MTYVWSNSDPKQACRDKIVEVANQQLPRVQQVFTLPSEEALCAKTFRSTWPMCAMVGVERQKGIFERMDRSSGIVMRRCTLREYIASQTLPEHHCDVAFFDLVGPASLPNLGDIVDFVANDLVVHRKNPMVMAVTFNSTFRHDRDANRVLDAITTDVWHETGELIGYTIETVTALLCQKIRERTRVRRLSVVHHESYQAQDGSTPMFFIILLVEKY